MGARGPNVPELLVSVGITTTFKNNADIDNIAAENSYASIKYCITTLTDVRLQKIVLRITRED